MCVYLLECECVCVRVFYGVWLFLHRLVDAYKLSQNSNIILIVSSSLFHCYFPIMILKYVFKLSSKSKHTATSELGKTNSFIRVCVFLSPIFHIYKTGHIRIINLFPSCYGHWYESIIPKITGLLQISWIK